MRVLHLAPVWFDVKRDAPGGIETYLPALLAELERQGCETTLLATAGSRTAAAPEVVVERDIWTQMAEGTAWEYGPYEQHELWRTIELAAEYDVVHSHLGWGGLILSAIPGVRERVIHTQHNPVTRDLEWFAERHTDLRFTTLNGVQAGRLRARGVTDCRVIPNGIDPTRLPFSASGGPGLVFLGRIEYAKGAELAACTARALGRGMVLAGPLVDHEFYETQMEPLLGDGVRYAGVAGHDEKAALLGTAGCAVLPFREDEGFPMVVLEALSCGTPVVALARGALAEAIAPGVNGYLAVDEDELGDAVLRALELDRAAVRATLSPRFELRTVARRYIEMYTEIARTAEVAV